MKKLILIKVDLQDAREKRKALKTVSALSGIDEISMDMKGKKLAIIGIVDPVSIVSKLRKFWWAEILIVGPVKESEKKEETKKEEIKKEEEPQPKKEEPPKEEAKVEEPPKEKAKKEGPPKEEATKEEPKKEEEKKEEPKKEEEKKPQPQRILLSQPQPYLQATYRPYYPPMHTYYQVHHNMEENTNTCNIC